MGRVATTRSKETRVSRTVQMPWPSSHALVRLSGLFTLLTVASMTSVLAEDAGMAGKSATVWSKGRRLGRYFIVYTYTAT